MSLTGQVAGDEFISNAVCDYDGARLLLLKWPMPFKNAKLSLINETDKQLDLDVLARVQTFESEPSPFRFCAIERQRDADGKGEPVPILKINGQGAFVGLALDIAAGPDSRASSFAFSRRQRNHHRRRRAVRGHRHRRLFRLGVVLSRPTVFSSLRRHDQKSRAAHAKCRAKSPLEVSTYRFHIPDPIPFRRELDFRFEHGNGNNAADMKVEMGRVLV